MSRSRLSQLAFSALLLGVALSPFFIVRYPPMIDFAQHTLLGRMLSGFESDLLGYKLYFERRGTVFQYSLFHFVLGLVDRLVDPVLGCKLMLAASLAALWLSLRHLLRSFEVERPDLVVIAVFPFFFSWMVFCGLLPFVASWPMFVLTVSLWKRLEASSKRSFVAAAGVFLASCVHLVGGVVTAFVICAFWALEWNWKRVWEPAVVGAAFMFRMVPLILATEDNPGSEPIFNSPIDSLKAFVSYNVSTIHPLATALNIAAVAALGATILWQLRSSWRAISPRLIIVAALGLIGLAMPISLGILWPAGPRVFPFAFFLALTLLRFKRERDAWVFASTAAAITLTSAVAVARQSMDINRSYDDFMSAAAVIEHGSRILPIVVEDGEPGGLVHPFWSIASMYNSELGGANPYVFAAPYWRTGEALFRYRNYDCFPHAHLYDGALESADYRGVERAYDYVLVWGGSQALKSKLGAAMPVVHTQGKLTVYRGVGRNHAACELGQS